MTEQAAGAFASPALADPGSPSARTTFAPMGPRVGTLIASCYFGLLLVAGALVSGVLWWAKVLAWLGLVLLVLLNWKIMRLAVVATPQGLIIRNFRNAHRIPWHDVEAIYQPGPVPPAMYLETALPKWKQGLFVRLAEGDVISCTIYNDSLYRGGVSYFDKLDQAVAGLNELRTRYTGGEVASSDVAGSAPDLLS